MGEKKTYKSLLKGRPILLLELDIRQPWSNISRVPEEILLIDSILIGLSRRKNNVSIKLSLAFYSVYSQSDKDLAEKRRIYP